MKATDNITIPLDQYKRLLQELRVIREECSAQSARIARIVGELTEAVSSTADEIVNPAAATGSTPRSEA
jgi:hypothetical protein